MGLISGAKGAKRAAPGTHRINAAEGAAEAYLGFDCEYSWPVWNTSIV